MTQETRYGKVKSVEIRVTTTGSAGSATGNTTSPAIVGQVLDVEVLWHGSAPNTSDLIVEGATTGIDLYAKSNAVTSVKKSPGVYGLGSNAVALTGDVTPQKYCIAEPIKVTVNQCDALTDAAIVRVTYRTVRSELVTVTTTGTAGAAAGAASTKPFTGELLGIALDYSASAPGTTDLTVTGAVSGLQYYAKSNSATDTFVVPVLFSVDNAGSPLTNDVTPRRYCVGEALTFTLAQCDALAAALTARVFYEPVEAETLHVTTTGVDGSATGSATSLRSQGEILGLLVNFHASAPATTDLTIRADDGDANHTPANIYASTDSVTDVYVAPGRFAVSNADAGLASNVTPEWFSFGHAIKASLAQCNALTDAVQVTVFTRPGS